MRLFAPAITVFAALVLSVLPVLAVQTNTARPIGSLSAAERANLPDATLVTLSKTGRTVSLGVLRSEHQLRLQRFSDAASLGKQWALQQKTLGALASNKQGTLVPMNFSTTNMPGQNQFPLPADYLAFCKAAAVTACLYVPYLQGTDFCIGQVCNDTDPLINDQQQCTSEGGTIFTDGAGCTYVYPLQYLLDFNAGKPVARGHNNVTSSANCPSPFGVIVDRGVVNIGLPMANVLTSRAKSCVVSVFVQ